MQLIIYFRTPTQCECTLAHSLSSVYDKNVVMIQVMNTGSSPVTLYKGTRLASFIPQEHVLVIDGPQTWEGRPHTPWDPSNISTENLTEKEAAQLQHLLGSFQHLFVENTGHLGKTSLATHSINTTAPPIKQPVWRLPMALKDVASTKVNKMLSDAIIRPSKSAWSSPVVLVKKKDQSWRFCVDFWKVSAVTVKDAYPKSIVLWIV